MTITIEKGIPLPSRRADKKYPFDKMEIGDSFLVPIAAGKSAAGIYSSISQARKRLSIILTSARVEGGLRIWRLAPSPQGSEEANG